jgi:hypothetical protein
MSDKQQVKWDKKSFMTSFYVNSGDKHKDWASFYGAMNKMCKAATGDDVKELPLLMRCSSVNRYLKKAGLEEWSFPPRPKKAPKSAEPSIKDIALEILGGDADGIIPLK